MIYADSSVIVKRYYQEPGTARVRERWASGERVFTSRVSYAEVHAALARKRREGGLPTPMFRTIASAFESEWPAYDQILVDTETLGEVRLLVHRHVLRGSGAIHLAAAVWLWRQLGAPVEFWVADDHLETAARKERLTVINPNRED